MIKVINIHEHFGTGSSIDTSFKELPNAEELNLSEVLKEVEYKPSHKRFHIKRDGETWLGSASYFVCVDWIDKTNNVAIHVQPKELLDGEETDVLSMLFDVSKNPKNLNYLKTLYDVHFNEQQIEIDHEKDLLTPFMIVQFLQILKRIVRKGLKKSYYSVTKNLESRIKGKILINQTIKTNILKNRFTKNICCYDEFGLDSVENRILKKALMFSQRVIYASHLPNNSDIVIKELVNYLTPAFEKVSSNINTDKIKLFKPNPLYKEYEQALRLAQLILKRFSYNIAQAGEQRAVPPFWIDMSKLFELYVLGILRNVFNEREIKYQEIFSLIGKDRENQRPDFLITANSGIIIDAKYKTYDNEGKIKINIDDIRQICGYVKLKKLREQLNNKENIECLLVYVDQRNDVYIHDIASFNKEKILDCDFENLYTMGIRIPANTKK